MLKTAYQMGVQLAFEDAGLVKTALPWKALMLPATGAGIGALSAGEGNRLSGAAAGALAGTALGGLGGVAGILGRARSGGKAFQKLPDAQQVKKVMPWAIGGFGAGAAGGGYMGGRAMADSPEQERR